MKGGSEQQKNTERPWPFDLSHYNRRGSLSKREQRGLAAATCTRRLCIGPNRQLLDRLITPLEDVLAYIAGDDAPRFKGLISVMLREMQARQLPFWGWSHEIWREILDV